MKQREVSVTIEEGGTGRILGKSDSIGTRSQIAISPRSKHEEVPATIKFTDIGNYNVFTRFEFSDGEYIYALVNSSKNDVRLTFTDMLKIRVINIVTDEELDLLCEDNQIEKLFLEKRLQSQVHQFNRSDDEE